MVNKLMKFCTAVIDIDVHFTYVVIVGRGNGLSPIDGKL